MQVSFGLPPEFLNQLSSTLLAGMQHELKRLSEAATVAKDADTFYTVKEAAIRLQLCEKTVLSKIDAGRLNAANVGTFVKPQWRVSKADLMAFYNANRGR